MAFTAKDVGSLRERTGCGMMDCKKALVETGGDMDKAIEFLREKGLAAAAKKAGRIAADGMVYAVAENNIGVILEVNTETDFVAKNEGFQDFVKKVAGAVAANNPADVDALMDVALESGETVAEALREKILTIGENIKIRRFAREEGVVSSYIHGGGRIGVLVKFDTDAAAKDGFAELAKDIAMQVAAANPLFLNSAAVPAETIESEKRILTEQVINEGKPAAIAEKIVMGKIGKYYKENCLIEQIFIKDNDLTVEKFLKNKGIELGAPISVAAFYRFEKGEGLQKREDNFADEVAGMVK